MQKKFEKIASRFRMSGIGLHNGATVLVSREAIYLVASPLDSAANAAAGGLLVGTIMDARGETKRRQHPLYHDLSEIKAARKKEWPLHKSGVVFVIPKQQVTAWSLSKMRGLVIEVGDHTAKIDVGLTGQGRARSALELHGWNAVMDGSADAERHASRRTDDDEWDDTDGLGESEDERDDTEEPVRRRRKKTGQRLRARKEEARDERFRRRMLLNYALPVGIGLAIGIVVIIIKVAGNGDDGPARRADNRVARDVAPQRVNPNAPGPNRNPLEKPADVFVSDQGRLTLIHNSGRLASSVSHLELAPAGEFICGVQDREVRVWNDLSAEPTATWPFQSVRFISASPDGKHVAVNGVHGFQLHQVEDGKKLWEASAMNPSAGAAWSPDGSCVACYHSSKGVGVWTLSGENLWQTRRSSVIGVDAMDFSPDGTQLLIVSRQQLQTFNAENGEPVNSLEYDRAFAGSCRLSAQGQILLFAKRDGVTVFDFAVPPGSPRAGIGPGVSNARLLKVSASGTVATSLESKTVSVWDTRTGKLIDTLTAQRWGVSEMTLSADGRRLAVSTHDSHVQIWEIPAN